MTELGRKNGVKHGCVKCVKETSEVENGPRKTTTVPASTMVKRRGQKTSKQKKRNVGGKKSGSPTWQMAQKSGVALEESKSRLAGRVKKTADRPWEGKQTQPRPNRGRGGRKADRERPQQKKKPLKEQGGERQARKKDIERSG